jgi:hypothetical protein
MKLRLLFLSIFSIFVGFAQTIGTTVSKKKIKIGEQIQLTLKTKVNHEAIVFFPDLDSIGKLEVVQSFPTEKNTKGNQTEWIKKYNLTQFDAGTYKIPKLEVLVNTKKIFSESIDVVVTDVAVDTTKQKMYDIKEDEIITINPEANQQELSDKQLILGLLFAIFLAGLLYIILRLKQRNKTKSATYISPYDRAFISFSELNSNANAKEFYSNLTQIIKSYFEKTLEFSALESTTEQFIFKLKKAVKNKKFQISETSISQIETLFNKADLVKFAKILIDLPEQNADKIAAENLINVFHKTLPVSAEEQQVALAKLAAQQQQNIYKNIRQTTFVVTLLATSIAVVFFFGWENVTNYFSAKINGKDANYYLKKEWLVSEYGLPILQIETPEILTRDLTTSKEPNIKNIAQFSWQKPTDKLAISLQTIAYKDSVKVNLQQIFNDELCQLMQVQAKKIKTTARKFKNVKALSGDVLEGTFEIIEAAETKKMQFFTVFISDNFGLQTVRITYEAKDKQAKDFIDRITNSLEQINQEDE